MLIEHLKGKRVLVTGASSAGFGCYFAKEMAKAGMRITVSARRLSALEALVKEIGKEGGQAAAAPMDVTDLSSVKAVIATHGPFDVVVNNAGVSVLKPVLEQSEEDYDFVVDTNLKGTWNVATEAARQMREQGVPGSIVNIASITGLRQVSAITPYAVSKAGVVQLTKQLGLELARYSIRVNAIAPGYFETDLNREFFQTQPGEALINRVPMRRLGDYESLRAALFMLASDDAKFITGAVIPVDGGHVVSSL